MLIEDGVEWQAKGFLIYRPVIACICIYYSHIFSPLRTFSQVDPFYVNESLINHLYVTFMKIFFCVSDVFYINRRVRRQSKRVRQNRSIDDVHSPVHQMITNFKITNFKLKIFTRLLDKYGRCIMGRNCKQFYFRLFTDRHIQRNFINTECNFKD